MYLRKSRFLLFTKKIKRKQQKNIQKINSGTLITRAANINKRPNKKNPQTIRKNSKEIQKNKSQLTTNKMLDSKIYVAIGSRNITTQTQQLN